jgi:hypothetical protein
MKGADLLMFANAHQRRRELLRRVGPWAAAWAEHAQAIARDSTSGSGSCFATEDAALAEAREAFFPLTAVCDPRFARPRGPAGAGLPRAIV